MTDQLRALRSLAENQASLATRAQSRELGVNRHVLKRRIATGEWEVVTPDVIRLVGSSRTPTQTALAAVLAAGADAALSHQSAAHWWGIPGFELEPVHVTVPSRRRRAVVGPVHVTCTWPAHHRTMHGSVPVTTAARTLADIAGLIHPKRLERALDSAWAAGLVSGSGLAMVIADLGDQRFPGLGTLRRLLDDRGGPNWVPPASRLESRFIDLIADAGDPPFERHIVLADDDGVIGEVDFLDRSAALVIEIDGTRFHSSPTDTAHDAARDERLTGIGLTVLRVAEAQLLREPATTLARVRRARSHAVA